MRLIAAVRALAPPAMAVSTHVPPALVNWSANTFTAADSPPEVHQWMTSALLSCANAGPAQARQVTRAAIDAVYFMRSSRCC